MRQAIIYNNDDLVHQRLNAALGWDELKKVMREKFVNVCPATNDTL